MFQRSIAVGQPVMPGTLAFEPAKNAVWAATPGGDILTVRLSDARVTVVGSGFVAPLAVVPLADALRVLVVEADGTVLVGGSTTLTRAAARLVAHLPGGALAAQAHPDPGQVLVLIGGSVDADPGPQLLSCSVADGTTAVIASGLQGATSFVADQDGRTAVVLGRQPDGSCTLATFDLDNLTGTTVIGPPGCDQIGLPPDLGQPGFLVAAADRVVLLDPTGVEVAAETLAGPVLGLAHWNSLVLAATGTELVAIEWGLEEGPLPWAAPLGPLYVGGYARIRADLPALGLAPGAVAYAVREGTEAGSFSAGLETLDPDGSESVMLLAARRPGEYHLEATLVADGSVLAERRFRVTTIWPDDAVGPPIAVTGDQKSSLLSWGGTGGTAGYLKPAPNQFNVLVVLVYLKDRQWDGLEVGARIDWKDRVIGGGESVRRFYEEVSSYVPGAHGTTVQLVGNQVFGPVFVDAGWGDVFKPESTTDLNAGWTTKAGNYQAFAGPISDFFADRADGAALLAAADAVTIVVRSGSDGPVDMGPTVPKSPTRYVWGHANQTEFNWKTPTTFTQEKLPVTVMTERYPAGAPQKNQTHTLAHEIGHNLGLADLYDANGDYPAEINERRPSWVDLMSTSAGIPHFSIANRIRLGYVNRNTLRRFDFSASPTGGTVRLQATETITAAGPTGGRASGIEVPITDDWSYLFEYRREQPGQIGDQRLEQAVAGQSRMVVGTDLRVRGGDVARPPILLLGKDLDADGPLLVTNNTDYQDSDTTNRQRSHDFTVRIVDIGGANADTAAVEVIYVAAHRPQLNIHPAPGHGNFKSPDIDVVGPFGFAIPGVLKGATNTVRIRVHNDGSLPATKTQIRVQWLPFTVAPGPWRQLATPAPFAVAAGGFTTIEVPWAVPSSVMVGDKEAQHFCVRVDIERYRDPAHPDQEEVVVFDNWAQSNFDAVSLPFGSPSDRVVTATTASNALDRTATYVFGVDQSTPWYRVFLGHAWLELTPGETRPIELAYESLAGDPVAGAEFERQIEQITSRDHHVAVTSQVLPDNTDCASPREVFGVGLDLRAGLRTWIERPERNGEGLTARVRARHNDVTFDVAGGDFHLAAWPEDEPERIVHSVGEVRLGVGFVLVMGETLQQLADGRRVRFTLARPGDNAFALASTPPALLE